MYILTASSSSHVPGRRHLKLREVYCTLKRSKRIEELGSPIALRTRRSSSSDGSIRSRTGTQRPRRQVPAPFYLSAILSFHALCALAASSACAGETPSTALPDPTRAPFGQIRADSRSRSSTFLFRTLMRVKHFCRTRGARVAIFWYFRASASREVMCLFSRFAFLF